MYVVHNTTGKLQQWNSICSIESQPYAKNHLCTLDWKHTLLIGGADLHCTACLLTRIKTTTQIIYCSVIQDTHNNVMTDCDVSHKFVQFAVNNTCLLDQLCHHGNTYSLFVYAFYLY